jgi:AsmA family protein
MRIARIAAIAAGTVALLLAAAIAYVMSIDFDRYRPLLAEEVKAATGRDLVIAGRLDLKLSLTPTLAVDNVRFANAPGGSRPDMATIARLEAQIALWPLLSGRVQIDRFVLSGADILLETDARGRGNWLFGPGDASPPATSAAARPLTLTVGALTVRDSQLTYRDGHSGTVRRLALKTASLRDAANDSGLEVALQGSVDDLPFSVSGRTGGFAALFGGTAPWPVSLRATVDKLAATVDGTIAQPRSGTGLSLDITAAADRLADLDRLAGAALTATGALKLGFHLADRDGGFVLDRVAAQLGASDLAGSLELRTGARPRLDAKLTAGRLNLADIVGPPTTTSARRNGERIFPPDALPFAALKSADATLVLTVRQLVAGAAILDDVAVDLSLENGLLQLRKIAAQFRGSPLTATTSIDARPVLPQVAFSGRLTKFDLGRFLKESAATDLLTGAVDLELDGRGAGASVRQIMAGLDGRLVMVMGKAKLATPLFDLIGADLVQSALPWAAHDRETEINCAVARFNARHGLATSEAMLLDTTKVTVQGAGTVDLAGERLALVLTPEPKERSLISLATPIDVGGSLAAPTVTPDRLALAKGAAGAVIGNVIVPFGFLVPLISGGTGDENPCVAALAQAKASPGAARPGAATQPRAGESGIGGALQGVGQGIRNLFGK